MTEINPPLYLQNGVYPATVDSTLLGGLVQPTGLNDAELLRQGVRSGVLYNGFFNSLYVQKAGTSVVVTSGRAVIDNGEGGAYLCTNHGDVYIEIDPGGTQTRNDIIGVRIWDAEVGNFPDDPTEPGDKWELVVLPGDINMTRDPLFPPFFIPIAKVEVPPGQGDLTAATIVDMRTFTSAVGGVIVCTSTTHPETQTFPYGQCIFEQDTALFKVWSAKGTDPTTGVWGVIAIDGVFNSLAVDDVPLTINGFAAQTADLTQWKNAAGAILARVAADGSIFVAGGLNGAGLTITGVTTLDGPVTVTQSMNVGLDLAVGRAFNVGGSAGIAGNLDVNGYLHQNGSEVITAQTIGGQHVAVADYATNAGHATAADSATTAGSAGTAGRATNADNADTMGPSRLRVDCGRFLVEPQNGPDPEIWSNVINFITVNVKMTTMLSFVANLMGGAGSQGQEQLTNGIIVVHDPIAGPNGTTDVPLSIIPVVRDDMIVGGVLQEDNAQDRQTGVGLPRVIMWQAIGT